MIPINTCISGIKGCGAILPHEHSPDTLNRGSVLGVIPPDANGIVLPPILPSDDKDRKALPIWTGVIMYFPSVWAEVAKVSKLGNDQHNPGQSLHWAREKSTDQMNTAFRHMIDHGTGNLKDKDGAWHLAKAIWRLCAELQLTIEKERK